MSELWPAAAAQGQGQEDGRPMAVDEHAVIDLQNTHNQMRFRIRSSLTDRSQLNNFASQVE
jgi:hypothetical protein